MPEMASSDVDIRSVSVQDMVRQSHPFLFSGGGSPRVCLPVWRNLSPVQHTYRRTPFLETHPPSRAGQGSALIVVTEVIDVIRIVHLPWKISGAVSLILQVCLICSTLVRKMD